MGLAAGERFIYNTILDHHHHHWLSAVQACVEFITLG